MAITMNIKAICNKNSNLINGKSTSNLMNKKLKLFLRFELHVF